MRKFVQHDPPHPGEILADLYLEPLGLTVTEAAKKLLITRPNLSAIINGKAGISALMAIKLARAFKTTPHYWLNLQAAYDLWQAMAKHKDKDIDKVKSLVQQHIMWNTFRPQLNNCLYSTGETFVFVLNNFVNDEGCSKPN